MLCSIISGEERIGQFEGQTTTTAMRYRKKKERIDEIRKLKHRREEMLFSLQEAEPRMDLAQVADIRYDALQEIDTAIAKLEGETGENLMLTETVGPEQIAEVRLLEVKICCIPFTSSMCSTILKTMLSLCTGGEPLDWHSSD